MTETPLVHRSRGDLFLTIRLTRQDLSFEMNDVYICTSWYSNYELEIEDAIHSSILA